MKLLLWIALVMIGAQSVPNEPAPIEAGASVYTGSYIKGATYGYGDPPWDDRPLTTFEDHAGKKLSILHWGLPWYWGSQGGYQKYTAKIFEQMRVRGTLALVDWNAWDLDARGAVKQPNFQLRDITAGTHDAYIRQWARDAKAWGYPFLLRFNHEMNGTWYPWSERANGNQAGDYVRAWRHVVDIFRQEGASNATWVWCPNTIYPDSIPLDKLYPGDQYVDWLCMDGYNNGTNPHKPSGWQSFDQLFRPTYDALTELAPSKPIMIGETSSTEHGGSKAEWITDALSVQMPTHFPNIKAWVWFNWNHPASTTSVGEGELDYIIETSPAAQQAYREGMASSYYAANTFDKLPKMTKVLPLTPVVMAASPQTVENSSFETTGGSSWYRPWTVRNDLGASFTQDSTTAVSGKHSLKVSVPRTNSKQPWAIQLRQAGKTLEVGRSYTVSFSAKASSARRLLIVVQKSSAPYNEYSKQTINLGTGWQRYTYRFTASGNESTAMVALSMAQATGQVWLDDVSLSMDQ